jgi:hypothetical protein
MCWTYCTSNYGIEGQEADAIVPCAFVGFALCWLNPIIEDSLGRLSLVFVA